MNEKVTIYEAIGGMGQIEALTARFYELMDTQADAQAVRAPGGAP